MYIDTLSFAIIILAIGSFLVGCLIGFTIGVVYPNLKQIKNKKNI